MIYSTLSKVLYQAYKYNLKPSEVYTLSLPEINLYIKAQSEKEHKYWRILQQILTGQSQSGSIATHKSIDIDEVEEYLNI